MKIVQCWIEHPVRKLDQTYTYLCEQEVFSGCRVRILFGSHAVTGFVESVEDTDKTKEQLEEETGMKLKYVDEVLDGESLLNSELHALAHWMRDQTLSTTISCFQAMLPGKVKPSSSGAKAVTEKWVLPGEVREGLTPKQKEAAEYVVSHQPLLYRDFRAAYPNQAKALADCGAVFLEEREREAKQEEVRELREAPELSEKQRETMEEIQHSDDTVFLLNGITGSGKTEIYLQLAAEVLAQGKQVLILVPEIALTPQMIARVSSRFGADLAIYHSGLNPQEKYEQYRMVKKQKAKIVVGTRSAVFLPFADLGLIVMDEEHDSSYKQDSQPAYHCRDIAIHRAQYHHCKLILGSATPSLDSYARALKNVYHLVTLDERVNASLPQVTIVGMRENMRRSNTYILSDVLQEKIRERLDRKEQVILLLNRRGYSSQLRCRSCNTVLHCPHCDLAMSWHRDIKKLKCHTCGTEMRVPDVCPECGSREGFMTYGFGTQRLEQELLTYFPQARILRMDADTTSRKGSHRSILEAFGNQEADLLIGTQMIAKGLDYPNVTLVGVINGDDGLARQDYHSCELTFDLLMQASGRSGRSGKPGEVILQVFDPSHYAVTCAAKQDYVSFFKQEMRFRHAGMYPPYTYLISLTVSGKDGRAAEQKALALKNGITGDFKVIGVVALLKIQDLSRYRVLLKGKDLDGMREAVRRFLKETDMDMKGLKIDVCPFVLD